MKPKTLNRFDVIALASRPGGMTTSEMTDWPANRVSTCAAKLVADGVLFRGKLSKKVVRYFGNKAEADEWQANSAAMPQHPPRSVTIRKAATSRKSVMLSPLAVVVYPMNEDGTPAYKHTIAPTAPQALRTNTHQQF